MSKEQSQNYIGIRNGVVVCVDQADDSNLTGRFYCGYESGGVEFADASGLIFGMERFFDSIVFPRRATLDRSFRKETAEYSPRADRRRVMSDKELLKKHGELGTFIIRVQYRQNSSWQGRITWMEQDQTICFRSVWEMIKLIASALEKVSPLEEEEKLANWS